MENMQEKIDELEEQNTALQTNKTKLVLRVRELEQDGKRLDWLERQVSVSDVCSQLDWDFNSADSLRQAIDKAMGEDKVSVREGE